VIWGVYQGALLSIERMLKPVIGFVPKLVRQAATFLLNDHRLCILPRG
jgi:hypothetical protein